jgi:hypothetical protein
MSSLEPDVNQIEIFVEGLFRHCASDGVVSLRAFVDNSNKNAPPVRITDIPLKGGLRFLMAAAEDDARRAANHPQPMVFCPPVATFLPTGHAGEADLLEGVALSVELDQKPRAALATLERLLGFATLVVRSGGEWTNPTTGEIEDKLHGHWRLKEPATGNPNLTKLKRAREIATKLVDGDPSSIPICHPMRWPGSWHRKATPRLCEILSTDHLDNEIDLDVALETLEAVAPQATGQQQAGGQQQAAGTQGSFETLDWDKVFGEIIRGEKFHPVLAPLASSFAARAVPEPATLKALQALLNNTQTTDPVRLIRRDAELAKLKATVRSGYQKFAATPTPGAALFDPWQEWIVPPFPLDILPGIAHDFVVAKSTAMGADPSALAMSVLTTFSGALDHRFRVKMMRNSDWYEHTRLWVLLFGRSSWLKSPIMDAALWPLRHAQADVQREYKAALRDWKANGGEEEDKPEPPERYLVADTTTEKLGEILSRSERGTLAEHDELAGWIGRMERYHVAGKGASADRAFYLRCWNGGPYNIDRVKNGELLIGNASLSILGGIQPKRLDELHDLTSDGLLQRFMIAFMREPQEPQDLDLSTVSKGYTGLVNELLNLKPQRFSLTDSAADAMAELQHHLFSLERVGGVVSEGFEGHIGKLKAYAGVLTLIIYVIENPKEAMRLSAIGKTAVEKAARLIKDFLIEHAREFYSRSEGETERLRRLAGYVLCCGETRLRLADFTTNTRDCRGKKVTELNELLSPLIAGDWLFPTDPGPACRAWNVNRLAIDQQFAKRMLLEQERRQAIKQLLHQRRRRV